MKQTVAPSSRAATVTRLVDALITAEVLQFGVFTLKSGRSSPYFLNFGQLHHGPTFANVIECYADAVVASGLKPDVLFGPAYKGIPLAACTAAALAARGIAVSFAYDRKASKDHGEGGHLVGELMTGKRVLILDDVLTVGTAARQAADTVTSAGGLVVGLLVAIDRQEAVDLGISVSAIATIGEVVCAIQDRPSFAVHSASIRAHLAVHGKICF